MFSKLIISQNNKLAALFISKILKEEFDEILNDGDGQRWGSSEIINFKPFKSNEIFTARPISVYFAEPEYNLIDLNGTTLRNIILNYIDSWKLMNLK